MYPMGWPPQQFQQQFQQQPKRQGVSLKFAMCALLALAMLIGGGMVYYFWEELNEESGMITKLKEKLEEKNGAATAGAKSAPAAPAPAPRRLIEGLNATELDPSPLGEESLLMEGVHYGYGYQRTENAASSPSRSSSGNTFWNMYAILLYAVITVISIALGMFLTVNGVR